jgi:hypothetical protein
MSASIVDGSARPCVPSRHQAPRSRQARRPLRLVSPEPPRTPASRHRPRQRPSR